MNELSMKELSLIEDEIRAEELIGKTLNWFASLCDDQEITLQLEQMAENHQMKVADLSKYFNRSQNIQ